MCKVVDTENIINTKYKSFGKGIKKLIIEEFPEAKRFKKVNDSLCGIHYFIFNVNQEKVALCYKVQDKYTIYSYKNNS